jgi:tripartite-type tricarboxylate transporter receptor subunit TctC
MMPRLMPRLMQRRAALALLAGGPLTALAQPATVRMIVPFGAGGATDIVARLLAERLSPLLGSRVVVENRQGAAGNIGAEAAVRSAPDGSVLLMASVSMLAVNPFLFRNMSFDPARDLKPVALVAAISGMVAATPSLPASNVAELIALARSRPGELSFASAGSGSTSHMQGELFQMLTGVRLSHVPYRAAAPAMADLAAGRVQLLFDSIPTIMPHVREGRLKPLAMASERSPMLPGVPTMAEQGVEGYDTRLWFGLMVPAATPEETVRALNVAVARALAEPELVAGFAAQGAQPLGGPPEAFVDLAARDRARWERVIRHADLRPE